MPLDAAEFISELSIVDPPGTDPLNQGDDQIRTTKRATQQSFPLIGGAVSIDHNQMNQMAIKNENNVFTVENKFEFIAEFVGTAGRVSNPGPTNDAAILCIDESRVLRWGSGRGSTTNDGGDWVVNRWNASGVFQATEFRIAAASGRYTFEKVGFHKGGADILDEGGNAQIALSFSDPSNSWSMLNENTGADGLPASTFRFRRFVNGAPAGNIFTINNANGQTTWSQSMHMINPNIRFTMSDSPAGSSKLEMGLLSDNSAFYQARNAAGVVSHILRADALNAASYVNVGLSQARFGVGTSSPAATLHVAGPSGLTSTMRVTGLPTGPGGGLASGDFYAKQSQAFAGTELVVGVQP